MSFVLLQNVFPDFLYINVLLKMSTACISFSLTVSVCSSPFPVDNAVISRLQALGRYSAQPSASVNGYTK